MRRNFLLLDVVLLAVSAAVLIVFAVPSLTRLRAAALEAGCMGNLDLGMKAFASYAAQQAPTGSNSRAGAAYRTQLVHVLTRRGLLKLGGM